MPSPVTAQESLGSTRNQRRRIRRELQREEIRMRSVQSEPYYMNLQEHCQELWRVAQDSRVEQLGEDADSFVDGSGRPGIMPLDWNTGADYAAWRDQSVIKALLQGQAAQELVELLNTTQRPVDADHQVVWIQLLRRCKAEATSALEELFEIKRSGEDRADIHSKLLGRLLLETGAGDQEWIETGARQGFSVLHPVGAAAGESPSSKFMPPAQTRENCTITDQVVNRNYTSVEIHKSTVEKLLKYEAELGWINEQLGSSDATKRVKLAVIGKKDHRLCKSDEDLPPEKLSKILRIIEDYSDNGLNSVIVSNMGETIALPTIDDLSTILGWCTAAKAEYSCLELDIASAFRALPVKQAEQKYLYLEVGGFKGCHTRLPFGLSSSPYIWGRFYGGVHRILRTLMEKLRSAGISYVDDATWFVLKKHRAEGATGIIITHLIIGLALSIEKLRMDEEEASFGGFKFKLGLDRGVVSVPDEKLSKCRNEIREMLVSKTVHRRALKSLIGRLVFITTLDLPLRSNISPLHTTEALFEKLETRGSVCRAIKMHEPVKKSLEDWEKLLAQKTVKLSLTIKAPDLKQEPDIIAVSDASCLAIAAVIIYKIPSGGFRSSWCRLTVESLRVHWPELLPFEKASSNMVILETLAIALGVMMTVDQCSNNPNLITSVALSDSLAAVMILKKGYTHRSVLAPLAKAILSPWTTRRPRPSNSPWLIDHLPGDRNKLADLLSRDLDFIPSRATSVATPVSVPALMQWVQNKTAGNQKRKRAGE
jgi:hypothetical protein